MSAVRLLRLLSLGTVVGAWVVIVIGGYVSSTHSGLGCTGLIECGEPTDPTAAAIEGAHRIAGWAEGFLLLGMLVLVWWRFSAWRPVRNLTTIAFSLLVAQSLLGIWAVASDLHEVVVTAHLGLATALLAVVTWNTAAVFRGAPPVAAAVPAEDDAAVRAT